MENLGLQGIGGRLDEIDTRLAGLSEKWMELYGQMIEFRIGAGRVVYDGQREKQKLDAVAAMVRNEFNRKGTHKPFSQIMTVSCRLRYCLLTEYGKGGDIGSTMIDELKREGVRVVYQGVERAHSHRATLQYFGEDTGVYHVPAFEDVTIEMEEGRADYGALSIESSLAGVVIDSYDNLLKHGIYIVAKARVTVNHVLLELPEASLEDIRRVYSYPQELIQCSGYLGTHRQWSQISVENTAGVVKRVLEEGDVSQVAAASPTAGTLYGLKILGSSINSNKNNTTGFIIVARKPVYGKDAGKVSVCLEGLHKNESLYNMLGSLIYSDASMLMIESRLIEGRSWEYRFFVNMEGLLSDPAIRSALLGIFEKAVSVGILGNYQGGREDHGYQRLSNIQEPGVPRAVS